MSRYFSNINSKNNFIIGPNGNQESWNIFNQGIGENFDLVAQEILGNTPTGPIYSLIHNPGPTGPTGNTLPIQGINTGSILLTNEGNVYYSDILRIKNGLTGVSGIGIVSSADFVPSVTNFYNLGTTGLRWREINMGPGTLNIAGPEGFTGSATIGSDADGIVYTEFGFASPFINIGPIIDIPKAVGGWQIYSTGTLLTPSFDLVAQENTPDGLTGTVYSLIKNPGPTGPQGPTGSIGPTGPLLSNGPTGIFWVSKNGTIGGPGTFYQPYLTINGAINAATGINGSAIWIMPGTYEEKIIIPNNVAIRGRDLRTVTISQTNVTNDTTLVTMGQNSRLEDVSLSLTSSGHYNLIGIDFPENTSFQGKVATITCTVDNKSASPTGTSNVYAVNFGNASIFADDFVQQLIRNSMVVRSIGAGKKRAINIEGSNRLSFRDLNIYSYDYGLGPNGSGTGTYYGLEMNNGSTGTVNIKNSSIFGGSFFGYTGINSGITGSYGDISQTRGTIFLTATDLVSANANGLSFNTNISSNTLIFGAVGTLNNGSNNKFFYPGIYTTLSNNPINVITGSKKVIYKISVDCRTAPSGTDTYRVFKNGLTTNLFVNLPSGSTTANSGNLSVGFEANDKIAVEYVTTGGGATDPVISLSLY